MDQLTTTGWLEWWANRVTCLDRIEIDLTVRLREDGRGVADGALRHPEEIENLVFFCEFDPMYTLRFPDDARINVLVEYLGDGRVALTEFVGTEPMATS